MLKLLSVTFSLIYSVQVFASYGMDPVPRELLQGNEGVIAVTNMPKTRTQDTLGICYSMVASTILDHANCSAKKIADCSAVPDSDRLSPLDMARFSTQLPADADDSDRFNYEGLREGGSSALAIHNALKVQLAVKESCAPFDQVVGKAKDPTEAQKLEIDMWTKFKSSYDSFKKKSKECSSCGLEYATAKTQELKDSYNLKASNQDILDAFGEETYAKFLDKLLVPDNCWDLKNMVGISGSWNLKQFPEEKKSNYDVSISKIKEVLTKKQPIALEFCAQNKLTVKSVKACGQLKDSAGNLAGAGHGVIIKGYRKVCKSTGDCYEALQIQNSWGESWQNSNSDGWVDAKTLLDRSFYEPGAMTWLEARQ